MDRYCYMLVKSNGEWNTNSTYHIYDRTVSHVKEIAICQDFGFAQTIVQALNNSVPKSNYQHRRA